MAAEGDGRADRGRGVVEAAWDAPGSAFAALLAEFGDEELRVIERYLRRSTEVGSAQAARLRER